MYKFVLLPFDPFVPITIPQAKSALRLSENPGKDWHTAHKEKAQVRTVKVFLQEQLLQDHSFFLQCLPLPTVAVGHKRTPEFQSTG